MRNEVRGTLTLRELTVLYALEFLADEDGRVTVAQIALARSLGWARSSGVRNAIIGLERRGLLIVHPNGGPGRPVANTFELTTLGRLIAVTAEERIAA